MRILFVSANDWEPWGGSEELWSATALELRARGFDVSVSVKWFGREVPRIAELKAAGCRIHYRRQPFRRPKLHLAAQRVLRIAGADYFEAADLVVINQGMNTDGLPWMQVCAERGLSYAVIAHAASESSWAFDHEAELLAEGYERAQRCFFVSQANLELTRKQLGSDIRHAAIIRNPFKVSYDIELPWPATNANEELRLACVGRLDPRAKGQDLVLDVLRMSAWRERRVKVSFIGRGLAERGLKRLAERYQLQSVRFSGFTNDIVDVWREHHALLLPSRFEGLPLAIVEAMLAGRPVIATDVGGHAEVVTDGETGFLAAAPTVRHLAEAMARAWTERGQLRGMGERAKGAIRELVPPDPARAFADQIAAIARNVAAGNAR